VDNQRQTQAVQSNRGTTPFLLATACALPFGGLVILGLAGLLLDRKDLVNVYLGSVFVLPFFLILSATQLLLMIFAWRKNRGLRRVLLVVYTLAILAYWVGIRLSGPW